MKENELDYINAEQSVLGSILLDNDAIIEAKEYINSSDFAVEKNRIVFSAMEELFDQDIVIDPITITDYLEKNNQLNMVEAPTYLIELSMVTPTAENIKSYAQIVKNNSNRRQVETIIKNGESDLAKNKDINLVISELETRLTKVSEQENRQDIRKIDNVLEDVLEDIQRRYDQTEDVTGLSTGYSMLDKMTTGLHPDELIIIAARPAVGKTAFALNIAQNVAVRSHKTVIIFSLEMAATQLVQRMLCAEGTIESYHLRTGELTTDEWNNKLPLAFERLSKSSIYIDDTGGITMPEIRAKCRKVSQETNDLGLIVIDYLQLIESSNGSRKENRQQEVSEISRQLKKLAKELSVPVIALSQLSRSVEQRQDKRPVLSDIRESGSIEQDADIVAFLYRDDYYDREDSENNDNAEIFKDQNNNQADVTEVIIEKNRSGSRGTVPLIFMKNYNKFASQSFEDVPNDR